MCQPADVLLLTIVQQPRVGFCPSFQLGQNRRFVANVPFPFELQCPAVISVLRLMTEAEQTKLPWPGKVKNSLPIVDFGYAVIESCSLQRWNGP